MDCNNTAGMPHTNELIHESSPYLLQHAHNPVNWYPWCDAALRKAMDEDKLLLISIGYAACHWCHVMEHESFEDEAVAEYMNAHFVCIKVDREERPDVDQVYMTAAQLLTGNGGWPLNALALPDGRPFFAGTYFPKENWLEMLAYFVNIRNTAPEKLEEQARNVTGGIKGSEAVVPSKDTGPAGMDDLEAVFNAWKPDIDYVKGGGKRAPKFPMPSNWEYLMQYHAATGNRDALKAVIVTLDKMAYGGIYDQLGGGFSRYATDTDWIVPHFEKMLYDNAQLVSLYSHAYQLTENPLYKEIVTGTLDFIADELTSPESGFYSSLDADSEGEEGKFYTWSYDEIKSAAGADVAVVAEYFNVSEHGNWEGRNILYRKTDDAAVAGKFDLTIGTLNDKIKHVKEALLTVRESRIKPRLDDKIITAWNGLMITGYVDAYRAFGDGTYLRKAVANADFLVKNMIAENNELTRNYKGGSANIHAFLDDYASVVAAFISLYQATFDEQWLYKAKDVCGYAVSHFFDDASGMFFYTNDVYANLIARKMEVADNVIPSSNSMMAHNLFRLGLYFDNEEYTRKAKQMLANVRKNVHGSIRFYSNWGRLELDVIRHPHEVAIVGNEWETVRAAFDRNYVPQSLLSGGINEGTLALLKGKLIPEQTTIYVCRDKTCQLPVTDVDDALLLLKEQFAGSPLR